jgi:hypothetical protein
LRTLHRSLRRVYSLLEKRALPATKIGGTWTTTANVLKAYIAAMARAGATE